LNHVLTGLALEVQFHIEEFLEFCKDNDIYHEYWL